MCLNRICAMAIYIRLKRARAARYSQNHQTSNLSCLAVTSWNRQPRLCVRTLGTNPGGCMCLLDCVPVKVQALPLAMHQGLDLCSSFCGCGASNLKPSTIEIAVALSSIAAASPLRWWQMGSCSKAHDPLHRFEWSVADQADNNVANMAILLAPSNPRQDSIAPMGSNQKPPY